MKFRNHLLCATIVAAAAGSAGAADVGVSVQVSQPGVYGRIDIGRFPQPQVIVPQPMVVAAPVVVQPVQPMYMWVPPGHRKHWKKHCHEYGACGVPVYFVRHDWYRDHVMVAAHEGYGEGGHGKGNDHGKGNGNGKGKGKGKGKGHGA